ncbi:helix-turn-helix transcriptional regulator [Acinetobacter sp. HY1485]|uniref:helix-turn-helix transcriptional regulator n=1 Tax=Acinetobacter sp. HY1485 TaxID=2970918 RepID=UPI0022B9B056|nr:AlpA family phage regulatory protein [Acinetobacter sp. HY1485]
MDIDRRVRAKEFMYFLGIGREQFYRLINDGSIKQPIRINDKNVFWYFSYVKEKVEEHKSDDKLAV